MTNYLGFQYKSADIKKAFKIQISEETKKTQDAQYEQTISDIEAIRDLEDVDSESRNIHNRRMNRLIEFRDEYKGESLAKRQEENKLTGLLFIPKQEQDKITLTIKGLFEDERFGYKEPDLFIYPMNSISSLDIEEITATPVYFSNSDKDKDNVKFQFWKNDKIRLVYFSIEQLKAISKATKNITISGATIDYGMGVAINTTNTFYPTLKFETDKSRINPDKEVTNMVIGIPCPTSWGNISLLGRPKIKLLPKILDQKGESFFNQLFQIN